MNETEVRGKWTLGIVEELFTGRDGIIRAANVKAANGLLGRAVNHLYPLELSYDQSSNQQTLNRLANSNLKSKLNNVDIDWDNELNIVNLGLLMLSFLRNIYLDKIYGGGCLITYNYFVLFARVSRVRTFRNVSEYTVFSFI